MNIRKITATVLTGMVFAIPVVGLAQIGIPCSGVDCKFSDLIILANNIIQFIVFSVAVPLAALGFMVVGAKLVLNQNKEGAWSDAKQSFELMAKGFGLILASFLLVKFVLYQFISADYVDFLDFIFA
jgi:hypothetical protein